VVLIARPPSRRIGVGCAVFAAALIGLHASYAFQAFRNLLPMAALACVTAGAAIAVAGERMARPRLRALLGALLLAVLLGPAALDYALDRARLVDSRRQALDWIAANGGGRAFVLILAETALPSSELSRLPGRVRMARWQGVRRALWQARPRFVLVPDVAARNGGHLVPEADREWLLRRYRIGAVFGSELAGISSTYWRGNRLRVWVLERRSDWRTRR
jgi:hypothetical protein